MGISAVSSSGITASNILTASMDEKSIASSNAGTAATHATNATSCQARTKKRTILSISMIIACNHYMIITSCIDVDVMSIIFCDCFVHKLLCDVMSIIRINQSNSE